MKNNTLKYFYEIMKVPRNSGKEQKIVNYLKNYAINNNLSFYCDNFNNIIIYKNKHLKNKIILQSHIDMVCESNCNFDFDNMSLTKVINGDFLSAKGTTLGADNGIGVSIILSLLQEDLPLGIEAVFTSEEETTMNGAKQLDFTKLSAKNLISFDGDNDSVIEISSAGFIKAKIIFDNTKVEKFGYRYEISFSNLLGGHSGVEIDKNHTNAILLALNFVKNNNLDLISIDCDNKDNVIPNHCKIIVLSQNKLDENVFDIKVENEDLKVEHKLDGSVKENVLSKNIVELVCNMPSGVLSRYDDGFVKTSLNIASINQSDLTLSLRSSNTEDEKYHINQIESFVKKFGFEFVILSQSPFFESDINSNLIKQLSNVYEKKFNQKPTLQRVHAGLEGGVFKQKKSDLNIAVLGANIFDMHSVNERVSLKSIEKVYIWVYEFLKNYDKM